MSGLMDHEVLALMSELLDVPSPPGREGGWGPLVRGKVEAMGYAAETDPSGNVVVRLGGGEGEQAGLAPIMVAAHLDEIALVVTGIEADGRLKVDRTGGLFAGKTGERIVEIIGDEGTIPGVLNL